MTFAVSAGGGCHWHPLRARKSAPSTNPVRLFPSTKGWFLDHSADVRRGQAFQSWVRFVMEDLLRTRDRRLQQTAIAQPGGTAMLRQLGWHAPRARSAESPKRVRSLRQDMQRVFLLVHYLLGQLHLGLELLVIAGEQIAFRRFGEEQPVALADAQPGEHFFGKA